MKLFTFLFIIFISIIIIITCAYYKTTQEGLTNNNTIILMGDSILNNTNYVSSGHSIYDILKTKTNNVINLAKDGATISDLYTQLELIPIELNNNNTYIFISAGGNNILTKQTNNEIETLFDKYMLFLKTLRVKLNNTKINILNLYLPSNPQFQSYKTIIDKWNLLINNNSNKIGEMYNVLDIHSLLTNSEDFVNDIEPSAISSNKIANLIYIT